MRILPLSFCPSLSETEIARHECSDRIWVPRHTFERWLTAEEVGQVVTVSLEGVPTCMFAPHSGARNIIYAPSWICEELGVSMDPHGEDDEDAEDDYIHPERLQPSTATFLRVQPHSSEHLPSSVGGAGGDAMPEDTLSRGFEEYTCIREGQTLMLLLPSGDRVFVTIIEAQPQGVGPLCIRNGSLMDTEIAIDLLEPLDRPQISTPPTPPTPSTLPTIPTPEPPQQPQQPQQPQSPPHHTESREDRRKRIADAALARLAAAQSNPC